jgi:hypothetical protein
MSINVFPPEGGSNEINPMLIDPVSKFRVSNPENLIDTDFEYGLQPTKWETVEIINNTPAFFSKGGDTTIPDITGITTNAGTREITVTTAFPHGLSAGIPIRVDGTKSVTADGSYIINATPSITTFTYLSKANQLGTVSIYDLYTSIITGEFFQGSQISISDSAGITTDGEGPISELTVKTKNKHGFGLNTPFYFLNLNSTISQEFEAQNTSSVSFDPTNSAVAQSFDGSNTANQLPIDFSNSASTQTIESNVTSVDTLLNTITVAMNGASWSGIKVGDPLYYDVSAVSGYFRDRPRGVVFIKIVFGVGSTNSTFQVSELPNGTAIPITGGLSGYFQLANRAKTFPGNNVDQATQVDLSVIVEPEFVFDGGNQGYTGPADEEAASTTVTVTEFNSSAIVVTGEPGIDLYVGSMLLYSTTGTALTGLTNNTTYFVKTVSETSGTYTISVANLPTDSAISVSGGTGTHTFAPIGVSVDRDIVHVKGSNFDQFDMVEYSFPFINNGTEEVPDIENGNFNASVEKRFYYIIQKYDQHNYKILDVLGLITPATQERTGTEASTAITPTEVNITGFTQPYSFAVTSGTLPTGLTLNTSTGVISGTPIEETPTRVVVITLTDVNGITGSQSITFQFNQAPYAVIPNIYANTFTPTLYKNNQSIYYRNDEQYGTSNTPGQGRSVRFRVPDGTKRFMLQSPGGGGPRDDGDQATPAWSGALVYFETTGLTGKLLDFHYGHKPNSWGSGQWTPLAHPDRQLNNPNQARNPTATQSSWGGVGGTDCLLYNVTDNYLIAHVEGGTGSQNYDGPPGRVAVAYFNSAQTPGVTSSYIANGNTGGGRNNGAEPGRSPWMNNQNSVRNQFTAPASTVDVNAGFGGRVLQGGGVTPSSGLIIMEKM